MSVQQVPQPTFKGGFRFANMPVEVKAKLPDITKKGKQIFNNFEKENDVFLVTRDMYDRRVESFIREHKLKFEYYPSINTKSGLDTEEPNRLSQLLLNLKEAPITSLTGLKKAIKRNKRTEDLNEMSENYIPNVLKALCIDNKHPVKKTKGVCVVIDNEFKRRVIISPPSKLNIHYVAVEPFSKNQDVKRYAIDSEGNILTTYSTPESIRKFKERFNQLLIK